jgi:putative flippase GtrA
MEMANGVRRVRGPAPRLSSRISSATNETVSEAHALPKGTGPRELASFAAIGLVCTLLFLCAYQVVRTWLPPLGANLIALSATAGLNFLANREFTFPGRKGSIITQAWRYLVFYVLGLALSSLALFLFLLVWNEPSRPVELTAALVASGLATAVRYVTMSLWVFQAKGS